MDDSIHRDARPVLARRLSTHRPGREKSPRRNQPNPHFGTGRKMAPVAFLRHPPFVGSPGEETMTSYTILKTEFLGELLLVANDTQLTGVYYADSKHAPAIQANWQSNPGHPILKQAREEILAFLEGKRTTFSVPLH